MKKLILFLILILTGCASNDLAITSLYIASIGLEVNDGEYTGYFLSTSNFSIASSNKEDKGEVAVVKGNNIIELFNNLNQSSSLHINFHHVSSLILDEGIMNNNDIDMLINYIINNEHVDFNIHIFTTKDDIKEILSTKNPNDESMILSFIVEPLYTKYSFYLANPPHLLNFCRDYYNKKTIHIPFIELQSLYKENDSISASGISFYSNDCFEYIEAKNNDYIFFKSYDIVRCEELNIVFYDYKYKKTDNKISVSASIKDDINIDELENEILIRMSNFISKYQNIDFLNQYYYGNSYNMNIDININKI